MRKANLGSRDVLQVGTWSHDVLYVPRYLVRPAPCEVQLVEAANRPNTYYVSTVVAALEVRGAKDKERKRQAAKLSRLHSRASREKGCSHLTIARLASGRVP